MVREKPTTQDLVEEMQRLHDGVGAANAKLAKVTEFLGAATKDIPHDAGEDDEDVPPVQPPAPPVERESTSK